MKLTINICIIALLIITVSGCGGSQKIKGIAERELDNRPLPKRSGIDPRAFNYFVNGTIFESMGEFYMAKDQYAKALEILPSSNLVNYSYASVLANLKEYRKSLNSAKMIFPKDVDAWILIGNDYRSLAIFDSSMISFKRALALDSNITSIYYFMGAYYQQEDNLDSVIWANQNIARLMMDYNSYQQLGNFQIKAGRIDDAIKSFQTSLELDSTVNNIRSYIALSAIYEESNNSDMALKMTEAAERLKPDDLMIQERLLRFYEEEGFLDKGIKTAWDIKKLAPDDKLYDRRLGILYYRADSLQLADSIFTNLIEADSENLVNYFYAGQVAYSMKKYELSKSYFSELMVRADTVLDGWMNMARVYLVQDSIDRAIETYEAGLRKMPNLDDSMIVMYSLAAAHEMRNDVDLAIEMFEKIIENQPNNGLALNYLGYMLADRGMRLDYARDLILRALQLHPENGAFIDSYGWVLYRLGDYRAALEVLLQAVQFIKSDPVVFEHVGDAYQALGNYKKAREFWGEAFKLDPDSESIKGKLYQ